MNDNYASALCCNVDECAQVLKSVADELETLRKMLATQNRYAYFVEGDQAFRVDRLTGAICYHDGGLELLADSSFRAVFEWKPISVREGVQETSRPESRTEP